MQVGLLTVLCNSISGEKNWISTGSVCNKVTDCKGLTSLV